jgi:hypothetical protein
MPYILSGIVGLALLALWLYVILEVLTTDSSLCRNLPKPLWAVIVILLPSVGSIAWLIAGRPQNKAFGIGGGAYSPNRPSTYRPPPRGIEDRADWASISDKLVHGPGATPDPAEVEAEKQRVRDAADARVRKLREWESQLIRREKELDDRRREQREQKDQPDEPDEPEAR